MTTVVTVFVAMFTAGLVGWAVYDFSRRLWASDRQNSAKWGRNLAEGAPETGGSGLLQNSLPHMK